MTSSGASAAIELTELHVVAFRVFERREGDRPAGRRLLEKLNAAILQPTEVRLDVIGFDADDVARGIRRLTVHLAMGAEPYRRPLEWSEHHKARPFVSDGQAENVPIKRKEVIEIF